MDCEREFTIAEMIGKQAVSSDGIPLGKITKIIDQSDSNADDPNKLCDIENDLFQIVVELNPDQFNVLNEATEILFSSQTLEKVVEQGIQLKLLKNFIDNQIQNSLR